MTEMCYVHCAETREHLHKLRLDRELEGPKQNLIHECGRCTDQCSTDSSKIAD